MQNLRVTSIQCDLSWENKQENILRFEQLLLNLPVTDLIVLPEMFNTGFSMNAKQFAEPFDNSPSLQWLIKKAQDKKAAIYTSLMISENSSVFNRGVFIKPNGEIQVYDKIKLFGMSGENEVFDAGQKETIIDYKGWKIKLQICYDLRFPEISRNNLLNNTPRFDVLIYTANWPEKRSAHWNSLLQARAIENQVYVVGVNRIGLDGNGLNYSGNTCLISPLGEVYATPDGQEHNQHSILHSDYLDEIRQKLPFLADSIPII